MNEILSRSGYTLDSDTNVWIGANYGGIAYSDGDEVEQRVASIIENTVDITVLSTELRKNCTDWPSLYHLSGTRANILRPFQDVLKGDILEIGAGCGAITRYLGECGATVLALEGSPRRAAIARSRTRDLGNVVVLAEKFDQFQPSHKFDCVTLIGVLEYASLFTPGDDPARAMLERARSFLKPDGKLFVAIENKLGLKYFAGAPEDHIGAAMYGLEGRYQNGQPQTFGRLELEALLTESGFLSSTFMAPFPDYKLPVSIVTELGFSSSDFDASAFAWQSVRRDPQLPSIMSFSPELVWPSIFSNGLALDLANSFLVVASNAGKLSSNSRILAYHYSTERCKEYCKETMFIKDGGEEIKVVCHPLSQDNSYVETDNLVFNPESMSAYFHGRTLSWDFINIVSRDGWEWDDVAKYYGRYLGILLKLKDTSGMSISVFSADRAGFIQGKFIDATPQNIVCGSGDDFRLIDTEWQEVEDIPIGRLLLRAILWQLFGLTRFGRPANHSSEPVTRLNFAKEIFTRLGFKEHLAEFSSYLNSESRLQEQVTGKSTEEFMRWWPDTQLPIENLSTALPQRDGQIATLRTEIVKCDAKIARSTQDVANKDIQIASLDTSITALKQEVANRDLRIASLDHTVHVMRNSRSWRYTDMLRRAGGLARPTVRLLKQIRQVATRSGGYVNLARKALIVLKREGSNGLGYRLTRLTTHDRDFGLEHVEKVDRNDYQTWIRLYDTLDEQAVQKIRHEIASLPVTPKISVVMPVYNAPLKFLEEAIRSVQNQLYENWELCIADDASTNHAIHQLLVDFARADPRIKVILRPENGHISAASNSALTLATGEFVALLDNDDLLPQHALYHVAKAIIANPDAALIYSDEDKITQTGQRYDPYFKCQLNYELLLAQNMVCHLGVYRRDILDRIKGFRVGFEGAQDYDLVLRFLENIQTDQVVHLPKILYHWRAIPGSTALDSGEKNYAADAARKAISEHLGRTSRSGVVMPAPDTPSLNRVRYALPEQLPSVSIIIPTRDRADLLSMCLDSLLSKTTYSKFEVIIIDNGSVEESTKLLLARQPQSRVRVIRDDAPFNYSRLNNLAVQQSKGDVICLMNNDIEILTPDWLEEMLSFAMQPDIGCVGARLWYPDGRLQHGGVILGIGGVAGHSHKYLKKGQYGFFGRAALHQSLSSVTAACLMIRRNIWDEVGGLDETFAIAFNDIDFCLRVRDLGYRNVWTPYAEMNHHESATRGTEDNSEKVARFNGEVMRMKERWGSSLLKDPAYSPNLTLNFEDFSLAWPPR